MDKSKRSDPRGAKKKNDPRRLPTIALTIKEKLFCVEYCKDFNSKRAAVAAGYSEKTAGAIGCHMLKKDKIKRHIDKVKNNLLEAAGVSALSVLLELKKVAFQNPHYLFDDWAKVKKFEDIPEDIKAGIKEIKVTEKSYGEVKEQFVQFQMHDKLKALEMIVKLLGLNEPEKTINMNENKNFNIPLIEWVEENEDEKQDQ